MLGKLFVVATPIGNLEDVTLRSLDVLRNCHLIACEDTRNTKKLLARYSIKTPITSYQEHNEIEKSPKLLEKMRRGENIALVSDAGTPLISDPGWRLVVLSIENCIDVVPLPGPSSVLAALIISGLASDGFLFLGFFPKTSGKRKVLLKSISYYPYTLVFYESAKRLENTLQTMSEILGERKICVAREMTKLYEEAIRGSFSEVLSILSEREPIKGEVTIVVQGSRDGRKDILAYITQRMLKLLRERGLSLSEAVTLASKTFGVAKNEIYREALKIWDR